MTDSSYNLLMVSGDSSIARGIDGPFYQMLRLFSQYWQRIDIITPSAQGASNRILFENVHIHPSTMHKLLQPRFIKQKGQELFAQRSYDLVVSHDYGLFLNGIGVLWLTGGTKTPFVSEIHHVEGYPHSTTTKERFYKTLAGYYLRFIWRRAEAIRVVNQHEIPELLRKLGVPENKILMLPALYIDKTVFHPMPDVTKRYDICFTGRFVTNKGIWTLLDAVTQVKTTHSDVKLAMLGDGPLKNKVKSYITQNSLEANVILLDRLPHANDVATFYNESKMLVCASTAEGGPRVTVEAMACGVPVISTPVGVMIDLIDDGKNGLLFNGQSGELAEKIRVLLDDDVNRQAIAEKGQESVAGFEAEQVIQNYAQGYHSLIESRE